MLGKPVIVIESSPVVAWGRAGKRVLTINGHEGNF